MNAERYRCPAEEAFAFALDRTGGLREAVALGYTLKYQLPIYRYRVDFAFLNDDGRRLVVEIDGLSHDTALQRYTDHSRDNVLQLFGFRVLRFNADHLTRPINAKSDLAKNCVVSTLQHLRAMPVLCREQVEAFDVLYRDFLKSRGHRHERGFRGVTVLDNAGRREYEIARIVFSEHDATLTQCLDHEIARDTYKEIVSYLDALSFADPTILKQDLEKRYQAAFERALKERRHNAVEFERDRIARAALRVATKPWVCT